MVERIHEAETITFRRGVDKQSLCQFIEIFDEETYELCGLEELISAHALILSFNNKTVKIPTTFEIYQTDGVIFDAIPATGMIPLPLLTVDGMIGVNRIDEYIASISKEECYWRIPIVEKKASYILECGLVVVVNPYRQKKTVLKKFTGDDY